MSLNEHIFRTDRMHLVSAVVMFLMFLMAIGWAPQYLFWILIFPFIFAYAVLKSYTVVNEQGITAHYAFRSSKSLSWDDFDGIRFGSSRSYARSGEKEFSLPGITFNSISALAEASGGRITDVIEEGRAAAAEKIVVINRNGYQVLKNKDELEEEK